MLICVKLGGVFIVSFQSFFQFPVRQTYWSEALFFQYRYCDDQM